MRRGRTENLALYSLIATCEANGVNPVDYLADVLLRIQTHAAARIDELLPQNWRPPQTRAVGLTWSTAIRSSRSRTLRHVRTALARLLSVVGHPFATMLVLATVGTAYAGGTTAMLVTAGMILPVAALIVQRRRSGQWRTVDASDRHDRPVLFAVAGTAAIVVLAALLLHGNLVIARWMASVLLIIGTAAFLNRHFKTSLHMAFAAFAGISLFAFAPRVACGALAMLPFLAWSRLHLQRHTHAEILAGTGLGAIAAFVAVAHL